MQLLSKSVVKMSYLTFYDNTRQGDAARDPGQRRDTPVGHATQSGCGNNWAVQNVASNPGMIPKGNFGNSPEGGCGIDIQSDLLFGAPGTARQAGPKQLFPRPWATTPFLGLGTIDNIDDQSKVMFGHSTANRASIQTVTDKQFPVFTPLLPELLDDFAEYGRNVGKIVAGGYGYPANLDKKTRVDLSS
jgi:hypothetical protein